MHTQEEVPVAGLGLVTGTVERMDQEMHWGKGEMSQLLRSLLCTRTQIQFLAPM